MNIKTTVKKYIAVIVIDVWDKKSIELYGCKFKCCVCKNVL